MGQPRYGKLSMERLEKEARIIRVLGHPHRLAICEILLRRQSSVGELGDRLGLKQNVVSQHLGMMRAHGIVAPRRTGRLIFYEITNPVPKRLLDGIREHSK